MLCAALNGSAKKRHTPVAALSSDVRGLFNGVILLTFSRPGKPAPTVGINKKIRVLSARNDFWTKPHARNAAERTRDAGREARRCQPPCPRFYAERQRGRRESAESHQRSAKLRAKLSALLSSAQARCCLDLSLMSSRTSLILRRVSASDGLCSLSLPLLLRPASCWLKVNAYNRLAVIAESSRNETHSSPAASQ
jgi:hypothetical protein